MTRTPDSTRGETYGEWRGSCAHVHLTEDEAWFCARRDDQEVRDTFGPDWSSDRVPRAPPLDPEADRGTG